MKTLLAIVLAALFVSPAAASTGFLHAPAYVDVGKTITYVTDEAATVRLPAYIQRGDYGNCVAVPSGSNWYHDWSCPAGGTFDVVAPSVVSTVGARASNATGFATATTQVGTTPTPAPTPTPPTVDLTVSGTLTNLGGGMSQLSYTSDGRTWANFSGYVTVLDPPCPFRYAKLKGGMRGARLGMDCPAGSYNVTFGDLSTITIWVDPLGAVAESNESNNYLTLP